MDEKNLELARCYTCGRLHFMNDFYLAKFGIDCYTCGGRAFRPRVKSMWPWERVKCVYWLLWEARRQEPDWVWWKHPVELLRAIWFGLTPTLAPKQKGNPCPENS